MVSHYAPIPRKNKGKNQAKNTKSEKDTEVSSEKVLTYGIDHLNLSKPVNDSENDSEPEK